VVGVMKAVKNCFTWILIFGLIWVTASTLRPFWDRYWLEKQMEVVATYGTKNDIEDVRLELVRKMKQEGYHFEGDDFRIEKDEKNSVFINIAYTDEITFFGLTLKELELVAKAEAREVERVI
jgi:c-di-GMP-related signal transduction protein